TLAAGPATSRTCRDKVVALESFFLVPVIEFAPPPAARPSISHHTGDCRNRRSGLASARAVTRMAVLQRVQFAAAQQASSRKSEWPSMTSARAAAAAGFVSVNLALPGAAETTGPADGGVPRNAQSVRSEPVPPCFRDAPPARERKADPPA